MPQNKYALSIEERLEKALEALRKIAMFGHVDGCTGCAPVHECCCQPYDQREIAQAALDELE
jgi:hypothetical protein